MKKERSYYIIRIQYLGFRFHGWQKQPEVNTVQRMVDRTLAFVLGHKNFKTLAAGRTDAKVSANEALVELFLDDDPLNIEQFFPLFNKNLPQDIRAIGISETDKHFNIIQTPKIKEYLYLFAFGQKSHPFASSLMVTFEQDLDIELMKIGASCFQGTHDFRNYTYKPTASTVTIGTIDTCEITENDIYTANFFPEKSYLLRVTGEGFKRNQVRLIMARLVQLGAGEYNLEAIKTSLSSPNEEFPITYIAPASGLILNKVTLK